ncbi:CIR protein [Plasmodium chabaudi adami]|uniref:CIR protein n=1 Tax=Plasmodium chabaudi adami TaxID=5826 RepID=A0A1C6WPY5_PLACE|nr:CIR protein [Plasmodium chabaudi adami]
MIKEVCEAINEADEILVFDPESESYKFTDDILKVYCPAPKKWEKGRKLCDSDGLKLSSVFIALLEYFRGVDEEKLEGDKLAEYAILWLSHKTKQNSSILFGIDDIYDLLIGNNIWITEHRKYTDNKKDMMNIFYTYLNNLYTLLKEICKTVTKCSDRSNGEECLKNAKKCVNLYQHFVKEGPKYHTYCSPYCTVLSNLKNDYEKFREKYNKDTENKLPELSMPKGVESCKSLCKSSKKESKVDTQNHYSVGSERASPPKNSLSGQSQTKLSGHREKILPGIEGQRDNSDYISDKIVYFWNKLKGTEGESLDKWVVQSDLRDSLPGLEGGSNDQHNVLSSHSVLKTIGGISPITKRLRDNVKEIIGLTQGLKGHEGLSGQTQRLKGQEGLSGRTYRLKGQEGLSGRTYRLKGLEGGSNEQHNVLSSHSGLKTIGGISPITMTLRDHVKEIIGLTQGLNDLEGGSLNMKHGFTPLKIEFKSNSNTLEDNANSPRKITTLFFDNPLGYSKSNLNDVKTQQLHPIFNGNKVIYIVVAFISIFIILGISYKYLSLRGIKKLKRKKKVKKIINICDKNKIKRNLKYIIENN